MISAKLANIVISVVTLVWVASFALSVISTTYKPDPQINVIFMMIVGGAMALKVKRGDSEESSGNK